MNNQSLQGAQTVPPPEALKNAIELAQTRVALLDQERNSIAGAKLQLEHEVFSLNEEKGKKEKELSVLEKELSAKKSTLQEIEASIALAAEQKEVLILAKKAEEETLEKLKKQVAELSAQFSLLSEQLKISESLQSEKLQELESKRVKLLSLHELVNNFFSTL